MTREPLEQGGTDLTGSVLATERDEDRFVWTVVDESTGERTRVTPSRRKRRGRKPKVETIHQRLLKALPRRSPRGSVRFMLGGRVVDVDAVKPAGESFAEVVQRHHRLLRKRAHPLSAELFPPTGQAAFWYGDAIRCVPRSGQHVARQLARLCGDDSQVTISRESLSDAVGRRDRAGRRESYTQTGVNVLVEAGWLRVEVTGPKGDQRTTYYLQPGERWESWFPEDDDRWNDLRSLDSA